MLAVWHIYWKIRKQVLCFLGVIKCGDRGCLFTKSIAAHNGKSPYSVFCAFGDHSEKQVLNIHLQIEYWHNVWNSFCPLCLTGLFTAESRKEFHVRIAWFLKLKLDCFCVVHTPILFFWIIRYHPTPHVSKAAIVDIVKYFRNGKQFVAMPVLCAQKGWYLTRRVSVPANIFRHTFTLSFWDSADRV